MPVSCTSHNVCRVRLPATATVCRSQSKPVVVSSSMCKGNTSINGSAITYPLPSSLRSKQSLAFVNRRNQPPANEDDHVTDIVSPLTQQQPEKRDHMEVLLLKIPVIITSQDKSVAQDLGSAPTLNVASDVTMTPSDARDPHEAVSSPPSVEKSQADVATEEPVFEQKLTNGADAEPECEQQLVDPACVGSASANPVSTSVNGS